MGGDDPIRAQQRRDVNTDDPGNADELCASCGTHPPANGTYWCSSECMVTWTAAQTAGAGPWPTPGYTETRHAGIKTVARDTWAWLDKNLPMWPSATGAD